MYRQPAAVNEKRLQKVNKKVKNHVLQVSLTNEQYLERNRVLVESLSA
jgi:hypothetical protein